MGNSASGLAARAAEALKASPFATLGDVDSIIPRNAVVPVLEVFATLPPDAVRELKLKHPRNLALLIVKVRPQRGFGEGSAT
jgi:hypothetical protein